MSKNLYKVRFVNQQNGEEVSRYVLATGLQQLEDEYGDILIIRPLYFEDLTQQEDI